MKKNVFTTNKAVREGSDGSCHDGGGGVGGAVCEAGGVGFSVLRPF